MLRHAESQQASGCVELSAFSEFSLVFIHPPALSLGLFTPFEGQVVCLSA